MLRPGNAIANNAADQLAVVDEAIGALLAGWRAGHAPGDDPDQVERRLVVRADTARGQQEDADRSGRSQPGGDAHHRHRRCREPRPHRRRWQAAVNTDGACREDAQVIESPEPVPAWAPAGTRAIVRRERPHPGASLRLWDYDGWRHQVVLTNDDRADTTAIEADHRSHAHV